jgi:uncharacterized damage-inducible protein DinB
MITLDYVCTMAAYNSEMNRRIYAAAGTLADAQRREDRGLFFGSIHATLNHLLWADRMWMSRFAGWDRPPGGIAGSVALIDDFEELCAARGLEDEAIEAWAAVLDGAWLGEDLVWFSGSTQREHRRPRALLVMHMFNHQTHHRGQVHAALTGLGVRPADTDLMLVV